MLTIMKIRSMAAIVALSGALVLTACSAPASPPVETIEPKPTESASTSPTEEPAAETGTRESPLAIGEQRKIGSDSMWSVGAEAATQVGAGYVVLPLHLSMDWEAAKAQGMVDGDGVDPWSSLIIEYVTAAGRSYDTADQYIEIPNQLYEIGTVYEPLAEVSANFVVTLPDAEISGGLWRISNSVGDNVFIAAQ